MNRRVSRIIAPECDCGRTGVLVLASKEPVHSRVVVELRVKLLSIKTRGLVAQLQLLVTGEVPMAGITLDEA